MNRASRRRFRNNRRIRRRDLRQLRDASTEEGRQLALRCLRGEVTQAQIERALAETGDVEPMVALQFLERWGLLK